MFFDYIYRKTHLHEMAYIGIVEAPMKLAAYTFSREYEFEQPHFNLSPKPEGDVWYKVEIPSSPPQTINDFEITRNKRKSLKKVPLPNNSLKKSIFEFFKKEVDGITNYERAKTRWNDALSVYKNMRWK
jgi:hypothetical protein